MEHPVPAATTAQPPGAAAPGEAPREALTFRLGPEAYGVDILLVREIRRYETPTRLPGMPPHMGGVVNLRGTIVPVIDLRGALGLPAREPDAQTVLIVLALPQGGVGLVVDAVDDVIALDPAQVKPPPALRLDSEGSALRAIVTLPDRLLGLLDFERLVTAHAAIGHAATLH